MASWDYDCADCGHRFERPGLKGYRCPKCGSGEVFPEFSKRGRQSGGHGWPRMSDALGVHPSQIGEASKWYRDRGASVEFDRRTGQARVESAAHQKQLCKLRGLTDRNGGRVRT